MRQIKRFGIELDVCPASAGVWLDRGELEKLMALIQEAALQEAEEYSEALPQHSPMRRSAAAPRYEEHHDAYKKHPYKGKYKKKGPLHQVMEIFDF